MGKHKHYYLNPIRATWQRRKRLLVKISMAGVPLLLALPIALGALLPHGAFAASYTWDGGGTTNNWSDCANWSSDICPVAADTVTFNATSTKDSVIDGAWGGTLTSLTIANGYTGTLSLERNMTITGSMSQNDGLFEGAGFTLDVGGGFILNNGANFKAPAALTVSSAFTINPGSNFNANDGTVTFSGTASAATTTIVCSGATFNIVTFTHATNRTKTISSDCTFPLGNNPTIAGAIILNGTLSGSGDLTTSTLTINSTSADFGGFNSMDTNGNFIVNSGATFTAPSMLYVGATFTINAGATFNANSGTIAFDGTAGATITCNNASFNRVQFTHTANTKIISSGCMMPVGDNPTVGAVNINGGLVFGSGTITFAGASTAQNSGELQGFSGLITIGTFTVNATTLDLSNYVSVSFGGTYTQTGGTVAMPAGVDFNSSFILNAGASFVAPAGNAHFGSTFTINAAASFDANGGTVIFDGVSATLSCGNTSFNFVKVEFDGAVTTSTKTVSNDCNLPLGHDPIINFRLALSGTLSGTGTLTVVGTVLTLNTGAQFNGFSGLYAGTVTSNGANVDFSDFTLLDFSTFTLNSGAFTAPTGDMNLRAGFILGAGATFNANGGTLILSGGGAYVCNNHTFNLVRLAATGSSTGTVDPTCVLPLGHDPVVTARLNLNGVLSGSGTLHNSSAVFNVSGSIEGFTSLTMPAGTFTLNNNASLGSLQNLTLNAFTINSANTDFSNIANVTSNAMTVNSSAIVNMNALQNLDVNGSFVLSTGGEFTPPAGVATFASAFTVNAGSIFNANAGVIVFDGGSATITCNGATFNLVQFNPIGGTKTVSSGCHLPLGHDPVMMNDFNLTLNGTVTGSGKLYKQMSIITINNPNALNDFDELDLSQLVVNADQDFSKFNPLALRSAYTQNSGTVIAPINMSVSSFYVNGGSFTAPSDTLSVRAYFTTANASVFNHNNGLVIFENPAPSGDKYTITCNGAVFNRVILNYGKHVGATCTLPLGDNPVLGAGRDYTINGNLVGSGTLTADTSIWLSPTYQLSGFDRLNAKRDLRILNNANVNLSSFESVTVGRNLLIDGAGVLTAPSSVMPVTGNLTLSNRTGFIHNNGTVLLNGTNQSITGDFQFYNLVKQTSVADTLAISSALIIDGALTLQGRAGQLLSLTPTTAEPDETWEVNLKDTSNVRYVSVLNSASYGNTITAFCSESLSENPGWEFSSLGCGGGSGGGGGSDPTTSVTNFTAAQAAAQFASAVQTSVNLSQLPRIPGLPSRLNEVLASIPGGSKAIKAFTAVLAVGAGSVAVAGGAWWVVAGRRQHRG